MDQLGRKNFLERFLLTSFGDSVRFTTFFILIATTLFLPDRIHGQELTPSFVPLADEALSNSYIRCFFKDSKGYMWIGTEDALIRYDGSNAHRYVHHPGDKSSIAHNTINIIREGNDDQLWIGTAQGLCIYNRELDNFINVDSIRENRNYLNNRYITDLQFDKQGRLWIGTHEGGINIYDPVRHEFEYIVDPPQGGVLPSSNFINILATAGDTMWCATKGGLLIYDTKTKRRLSLNALNRFADAQISAIVPEATGSLLVATLTGQITRVIPEKGSYRFLRILSGPELGESANKILTMCVDRQGNILAGGENSGFNIVDPETTRVHRLLAEHGSTKRLPTNSVESIYVDDLGLVWIGTFSNGVYLMDGKRKKFETPASSKQPRLQNREVRSFAEDAAGNTWIASYGLGLARIKNGSESIEVLDRINDRITNKNVTSIMCDQNSELWLGTAGKGVFRIDPISNRVTNYPVVSDGFGNDQVFCLYEDRSGTVWAGTWGSGLFYFDSFNEKFVSAIEYNKPNHIPNTAYVSDILEDSRGTFWIGTLYGLYELTRQSGYSFSYRLHLPGNSAGSIIGTQIQAVLEDDNKNLWIGTPEGLNLRTNNSSTFSNFRMGQRGIANPVRSILTDRHGNVWIGGSSGLSKFDRATKSFINYSRQDGLTSNNFQRKSALASSSGKLFFGSDNGFDSFFPDSIQTAAASAAVVLSDLKINNQSVKPGVEGSPLAKHISLTSELDLSYDQRSFVIDFVALDYSQSSNYTYCYKLEGFDKDWNCAGKNHSATYTNIDPGSYVFLVKAANRDGLWLDQPLMLEITIEQAFWKTWWAFSIYAAILVMMVYVLMRIRIERMKLKNEVMFEKHIREQEHELSESKMQFFTNVAHEFRTPLSLIMIPLESLMETHEVPPPLRARIYTAHKNASRMKRLVNELLDFNKLEAGNLTLNVQHGDIVQFISEISSAFNEMAAKRRIRFSVVFEEPVIMGWFDRDKLERIIFNVLSNAFKFTADAGGIKLKVNIKQSVISDGSLCRCVELVIEDNGIGISPEEMPHIFEKFYQAKSSTKITSPGTGIGLSLTKALVEIHNGTIVATSVPDQSTIFTILLPIDASVYNVEEAASTLPILYTPLPPDEPVPNAAAEECAEGTEESTDKPKILVVEDNVELREYLVAELKAEFTVLEAAHGEEGLTLALEGGPDLIISDIMMPVKDGIEFCNEIKSNISTSHIPFILLTAKATVDDQIKGIKTGADLYVPKPFNVRYLITHVQQMIESRRKLYARFSQDVYLMPGKVTTNSLDQEFLQKAIDYIIGNLQDPQLGVESIGELFHLSRMQAYRKIKALTGKSVVEFIRMVRMKQAIKLMDSHKLTLSEIAFEVGFNSASYFTRCFKDEFGKTPSEYLEGNLK